MSWKIKSMLILNSIALTGFSLKSASNALYSLLFHNCNMRQFQLYSFYTWKKILHLLSVEWLLAYSLILDLFSNCNLKMV